MCILLSFCLSNFRKSQGTLYWMRLELFNFMKLSPVSSFLHFCNLHIWLRCRFSANHFPNTQLKCQESRILFLLYWSLPFDKTCKFSVIKLISLFYSTLVYRPGVSTIQFNISQHRSHQPPQITSTRRLRKFHSPTPIREGWKSQCIIPLTILHPQVGIVTTKCVPFFHPIDTSAPTYPAPWFAN